MVIALLTVPGVLTVEAQSETTDSDACATRLLQCYERAARIENFWYRWAAGIDCELNFTSCVRTKLIGS
jgi:hypothetical protein